MAKKSFLITLTLLMSVLSTAVLSSHTAYSLDPTTTVIYPNPSSTHIGQSIIFKAVVDDYGENTGLPYGTVSWNDGGAGGSFKSTTCTLAALTNRASSCSVVYTPPPNAGLVTIKATFSGDPIHSASIGTSALTVNLRATKTTIFTASTCCNAGEIFVLHIKVADFSAGTKTPPRYYSLDLSDGGAGGIFKSTCPYLKPALSGEAFSTCYAKYLSPSGAHSTTITINATYVPTDPSDGTHAKSSALYLLTFP